MMSLLEGRERHPSMRTGIDGNRPRCCYPLPEPQGPILRRPELLASTFNQLGQPT